MRRQARLTRLNAGGRRRAGVGCPGIETPGWRACGHESPDPAGDHNPPARVGAVPLRGMQFPFALQFRSSATASSAPLSPRCQPRSSSYRRSSGGSGRRLATPPPSAPSEPGSTPMSSLRHAVTHAMHGGIADRPAATAQHPSRQLLSRRSMRLGPATAGQPGRSGGRSECFPHGCHRGLYADPLAALQLRYSGSESAPA